MADLSGLQLLLDAKKKSANKQTNQIKISDKCHKANEETLHEYWLLKLVVTFVYSILVLHM